MKRCDEARSTYDKQYLTRLLPLWIIWKLLASRDFAFCRCFTVHTFVSGTHDYTTLTLPRPLLSHIYAARTGYGDFASYHERFKHDNYLSTCSCETLKSPTHMLRCTLPKPPLPRKRIYKNSRNIAQYYLGTFEGVKLLTKWLDATKFFINICTRSPIRDQSF